MNPQSPLSQKQSQQIIWWLSLLFLCFTPLSAAQDETWQAWLYNPGDGEMTLVDGRGFIQGQSRLRLPTGYEFYPFDIAISRDGERAAYVVSDSANGSGLLLVFDLQRREIVLEYPLDSLFADSISLASDDSLIFNSTGSALAFGYSLDGGGWRVLVIDLQAGLASLMLRDVTASVRSLNIPDDPGMTPVVRAFDGTEVIFTMVQASELGSPNAVRGAYRWHIRRNELNAVGGYNALDGDIFTPSGEAVIALVDTAFVREGSSSAPNTLYVYEPENSTGFPVYAAESEGIFSPRFIQNGEKVLFGTYDADGLPRYFVLGRDGNIETEWETGSQVIVSSIHGTAEGFIYTVDTINPDEGGSSTLYNVNTFTGLDGGEPLFTSVSRAYPRIVWLNDPRLRQIPLPPWRRILPGEEQNTIADPTPAAPSLQLTAWQAWIYQDDGSAVRVNQDGAVLDSETIQVGEGQSTPAVITTSNDGSLLTYTVSENGLPVQLQVYDTRRDRLLMQYAIPHDDSNAIPANTIERAPYHRLFSQRDQTLAFGFGLGEAGWQITVLETLTGDVLAELRHDSPAMLPLGTESGFGVVPVIQRHEGDEVYFTVHPAGVLNPPYSSFIWNLRDDTVNPTQIYASITSDHFAPTGEVIMSMIDDRLPNTADRFAYGQLNALHVYDPQTAARYPFYVSQELWLFRPQFIQNGERILVGGSDPSGAFSGWVVIERHGGLVGVVPFTAEIWSAAGVGDGFLYIPREETGTLSLYLVNTRSGVNIGQVVWQAQRAGKPQIAWVNYERTVVDVPGWARLNVPIAAGQVQLEPESVPDLAIGTEATIRVTGGDALQVRLEPGTGFALAGRLSSGTTVTLIDGPRLVNGVNWWRVRSTGGLEGWVIERINGTLTLTPQE